MNEGSKIMNESSKSINVKNNNSSNNNSNNNMAWTKNGFSIMQKWFGPRTIY